VTEIAGGSSVALPTQLRSNDKEDGL